MKPAYRLKIEKKLGRKLRSDEIVHHKDGDSHNNDISNLEIVTRSEHAKKKHRTSKEWQEILEGILVDDINVGAKFLNEYLSMFFTERQKQLIIMKVYDLPFSKTEREYFSRNIKKKLEALSSPVLHRFAQSIITRKAKGSKED
jgi:hypothetical protein